MMNEYGLSMEDQMPTDLERSMLDKERKDLLTKDDMLKLIKYFQEDQLPQEYTEEKNLYFCSTGKTIGLSFLRDQDEAILLNRFQFSQVLRRMEKPRSEKTMQDFIFENETFMNLLANIRKSQGFQSQAKTNILTLFSTIVKHNVHTMTDSGPSGGIFSKIGRFFKSG